MRIVAIGSRVFITSFQLAGVQGLKVESPSDALTEINKITGKNDVGLVLLSDMTLRRIYERNLRI